MVQVFKILRGIDNVDFSTWFTLVGENVVRPTRSTAYAMNLIPSRNNTDIRKNFFSNRVVSTWKLLPTELKKTRTLNTLKTGLENINIQSIMCPGQRAKGKAQKPSLIDLCTARTRKEVGVHGPPSLLQSSKQVTSNK